MLLECCHKADKARMEEGCTWTVRYPVQKCILHKVTSYSHHADARCDGVANPNDSQLDILHPGAECNIVAACRSVVNCLHVQAVAVMVYGK